VSHGPPRESWPSRASHCLRLWKAFLPWRTAAIVNSGTPSSVVYILRKTHEPTVGCRAPGVCHCLELDRRTTGTTLSTTPSSAVRRSTFQRNRLDPGRRKRGTWPSRASHCLRLWKAFLPWRTAAIVSSGTPSAVYVLVSRKWPERARNRVQSAIRQPAAALHFTLAALHPRGAFTPPRSARSCAAGRWLRGHCYGRWSPSHWLPGRCWLPGRW
jgi:hypothetical protein